MSGLSKAYEQAEYIPGQPIPIKPPVAEAGVFPIEALSPKLEDAARAIIDKVQIPAAIAAQAVLATAALVVQPFVDVELPTGEVVPTSLFLVSIADSGDRKSSTDKLALAGVRRRETEMREDYKIAQTRHSADALAYATAKKKATQGNRSRDQIRDDLELLGPEPIAPALPMLLSDEGTLQGLQRLFADAMPSLGLFSDEGGMWLGGYAMQDDNRVQTGAALSKLWDGAPIKRVRASDVITFLPGRRLALHLMIQKKIARKLFGDSDLKSQGLLSRILVCEPRSIKGERIWRDPDASSAAAIERFEARVSGLLARPMPMEADTRELKPGVLKMTAEARDMWIAWSNAVELEQKPGGAFDDITGFASKLPEHAARLAAVMSYFESANTDTISANALSAGIKLAKFYATEALRVIGMGSADEDSENAETLIAWVRSKGERVVGKRWLSRNVIPKSLRGATTLARAVNVLIEHGHLHPLKDGGVMTVNGKEVFYKDAYTVIADEGE